MPDWLELSTNVLSRASDALTEAKQQVQAISQKDLDPQNIDWSKISDNVLSRASDALTEAKQLVNQAASQGNIDLQNVDWSKLSVDVTSRASDTLTYGKQLVDQTGSQKYLDLININWSKVSGNIPSRNDCWTKLWGSITNLFSLLRNHWTKLWYSIFSSILFPLTEVNNWSIRHPYKSAGTLLLISVFEDPTILLTIWQLILIMIFLFLLFVRCIIWVLGFRSRGVKKGSVASRYQSCRYGGNVPRCSVFAKLQSCAASRRTVTFRLLSAFLSFAGAVVVLIRQWWM
jgi:hypothetical protein